MISYTLSRESQAAFQSFFENYVKKRKRGRVRVTLSPGALRDGKPAEMSFITNQLEWSPYSICDLYLARWGIEVFFKEIKQTLQLADFLGTSENAIKWQIWTALLAYLLLRLTAWLGDWERSFRSLFTLVKGMLWSRRSLPALFKLVEAEENGVSPPVRLSDVQLQFDFGDI